MDIPELPLVQVEEHGRSVWAEQAPEECPVCGAPWGPGQVLVGWEGCGCQPGSTMAPAGHRVYRCGSCREKVRVGHVEA